MFNSNFNHSRLDFFSALLLIGATLFGVSALAQSQSSPGKSEGVILSLKGPVTPPVASYLKREIEAASAADKNLIILEIDTPGGLVDSMKEIIKAILASDTPIATYVSPQGARSASAGLYIMYGAHISAMAPATNTGAATPVEIGGGAPAERSPLEENPLGEDENTPTDEDVRSVTNPEPIEGGSDPEELDAARDTAPEPVRDQTRDISPAVSSEDALRAKVINDSVAYIRALAEERGRNADWAEDAVRDAVSITANEALALGVIDLIADDIDDLLAQINGQTIETASGEVVLDTENIVLERVEATLTERILSFIANPSVAVILMSLATTGIIAEIWNPGSIFPGVLGVTFLLLGLYSFSVLPYNDLGAGLMVLGAVLIFVEAFLPTAGFAGITGLLVFGAGLFLIFPDGFRVSPFVIGSILGSVGAFLGAIFLALVGSRSHGPMIGADAIRKREGIVDDWDGKEGWVIVEGERWRARSDKPLSKGDKIRVVEVDGLVLIVKQAKAGSLLGSLVPGET